MLKTPLKTVMMEKNDFTLKELEYLHRNIYIGLYSTSMHDSKYIFLRNLYDKVRAQLTTHDEYD